GHFFEYQDAMNNIVRIKVTGNDPNAGVTLTGATEIQVPQGSPDDLIDGVADAQFPIINDVPGAFDGDNLNNVVLGGVGGLRGTFPIAYATTGGNIFQDSSIVYNGVAPPSSRTTFTGLASNSTGDTWGLNLRMLSGMQM